MKQDYIQFNKYAERTSDGSLLLFALQKGQAREILDVAIEGCLPYVEAMGYNPQEKRKLIRAAMEDSIGTSYATTINDITMVFPYNLIDSRLYNSFRKGILRILPERLKEFSMGRAEENIIRYLVDLFEHEYFHALTFNIPEVMGFVSERELERGDFEKARVDHFAQLMLNKGFKKLF